LRRERTSSRTATISTLHGRKSHILDTRDSQVMSGKPDEVFFIEGERLKPLPARPFRFGLFGKTLEEALQELIERHPEVLPGKQMDPGSDDPPRFVLLYREMP